MKLQAGLWRVQILQANQFKSPKIKKSASQQMHMDPHTDKRGKLLVLKSDLSGLPTQLKLRLPQADSQPAVMGSCLTYLNRKE